MQQADGTVDLVDEEYVVGLSGAALFAALAGALAYLSVPYPLSPAPVTLQVLGIFLMGVFLGAKWGGLSAVLYVLAGSLGAPIFAGGGAGFGTLLGVTGGYLWSYPIAVVLMGWLAYGGLGIGSPQETSDARLVAALAAGTLVIYAFGTAQMLVINELALVEAIMVGAVVFFPAEAAKIAAVIAVVESGAVPDWSPTGAEQRG
ncbi:biotin transport system substrate-specific component [Natronoarchaeum philippinense]|uniref:Biotin transport system substrate-specific component n=1 Tax=Natronoarchaeum philippinense TaxID=558529 RepID=A0A285NZG3_NATPI|nr:biotin transporter BioY [Natronoarchaeum philippinense]SNZ14882.1 biotin transport system substrate-specific component [Natronoarchaeum philippinense]